MRKENQELAARYNKLEEEKLFADNYRIGIYTVSIYHGTELVGNAQIRLMK